MCYVLKFEVIITCKLSFKSQRIEKKLILFTICGHQMAQTQYCKKQEKIFCEKMPKKHFRKSILAVLFYWNSKKVCFVVVVLRYAVVNVSANYSLRNER